MKKSLLIIAIFMLLAATTAKVFAQNTPMAPAEGGTFNYVIGGLTAGDTYIWGISTAANDYTTTAGGKYTVTSTPALGVSGTVAVTSATLTVTWETGASGKDYWVWIQIIDSQGCSTFRALPVSPVAPLPPYVVDFTVDALNNTGDEATAPADIISGSFVVTAAETCPKFVDEKWIADSLDDNTMNDGNSYVYFRVTRTTATGPASGWNITPIVSTASAWEVSTDASTWTSMNATQSVASGNVLYVRATVPNATTEQVVSFDIAATGQDAGSLFTDANTIGSNVATITILPLPTVGTFDGSN